MIKKDNKNRRRGAGGQNSELRMAMDYLAESGLEHAKGLLLNPQEISGDYWTGAIDLLN